MQSYFHIRDFDARNKTVLVRVDFNVPLENKRVVDNTRIKATLPTISYLLQQHAKIILISHLGRPKGIDPAWSLKPIAEELERLIDYKVQFANGCIGEEVKKTAKGLAPKEILLLENLRFHKEEEDNDETFASKLAECADYYINDAFAATHRAHASVDAITSFIPSGCGFLIERELKELKKVLNPKQPLICIIGGLKISDKIGTIEHLAKKADKILVGGAVAASFLKAKGINTGATKTDAIDLAARVLHQHPEKIVLPKDVVIADKFDNNAERRIVNSHEIPDGWMMLDIGPETCDMFNNELKRANTVLWNGPLGVFEFPNFMVGTQKVANFLCEQNSVKIVGGSESVQVVNELELAYRFTYVATGGGATLEFLGDRKLPAITALERSYRKFSQRTQPGAQRQAQN
ncbi:phosphoglycerate kinase [Candidatus Woesearchaeota archaeon]|nr:phosphoglycerate kinase [Candidatus Woesearchaeota archaeon]